MSYEEYVRWKLYNKSRGIVSTSQSIERAAALIVQALRGGEFERYLPPRGEPTPDEPATVEQAMAILGGTVKRR